MSLGFGVVTPEQWNTLKKGTDADEVPAGDYIAVFKGMRHIDPSKNDKGIGTFILSFHTTVDNSEEYVDKVLEARRSYHPNPSSSQNPDGFAKMTEISQQDMVRLVDRLGMEPVTTPDGQMDLVASIEHLAAMEPQVLVAVTKRKSGGREYQDVGNFRPVA